MSNKVKFIYNPYSGNTKIVSALDNIIQRYQDKGYIIEPFRLTYESKIDTLLNNLQVEEYHHILIAGGDGTVNIIINEIVQRNIDLPVAVLPAGTANDFAKVLGYSSSLKTACKEILEGEVQTIDLGKVNDRYFVNVLSFGLLTDISQKTPTILKNTFGKLAYYFRSLGELPKFTKIHLKIESKELYFEDEALMFFVFNGRTAGNLNLAYKSDIQDGYFDVLIVRGENVVETIQTVFHFITKSKNDYPKGVVHFKSKQLEIHHLSTNHIDIDGETGPLFPLKVICLPHHLKVIIPSKISKSLIS